MATYPPPTEKLPDFNPGAFSTNDTGLTINEGKKYFLTYPTAQGTENLTSVNVSGDLTTTNSTNFGTVYGYGATKPTSGTSVHNTAYGFQSGAGLSNTTASGGNSGFGAFALYSITTTGENNTAIGHNALRGLTTGTQNTQVGFTTNALSNNLTTGNSNTLIGYQASVSGTAVNQSTAIGYNAQVSASNQIVLGTTAETIIYNKLSPLYTAITFGVNDIGYQYSLTLTFTTPAVGATIATSASLPIGVWAFNINLTFTGVWNSSALVLATGVTNYGLFPIVASTTSASTAGVNGSSIVSNTSARVFTIIYNSNVTSTLTAVTVYNQSFITITRIA